MIQTIKMNIVLIQKVEILKMAFKMAVSKAPKTYLTNIFNKNHLNFVSYGCKRLLNDAKRLKSKLV